MEYRKSLPAYPVIAIAGATGAVGKEFMEVLHDLDFPASKIKLLASARSAGTKLFFKGCKGVEPCEIEVEEMRQDSFEGVDLALFSCGAARSKEFRDAVVKSGALMIDNSSAFRMDADTPLVVPEVNPEDAFKHQGVIANPNCSTIQMVVALKPLYNLARIKRVVVATYQAASGAGAKAMEELHEQTQEHLAGKDLTISAFKHQIAFNCIPHIDVFMDDGSTKEEWKMVVETKKIMGDEHLEVSATCVRVPVLRCHGEAVHVEFESALSLEEAREALSSAPGICLMDDRDEALYPMPGLLSGTNDTYVGRLRKDASVEHGLAFWVVADQIRKGAALNAVQIAELFLEQANV